MESLLALSASAREHYRPTTGEWLVTLPGFPRPTAIGASGRRPPRSAPRVTGPPWRTPILGWGPNRRRVHRGACGWLLQRCDRAPPPTTSGAFGRSAIVTSAFIADEILTGAGRTGKLGPAIAQFGVVPDLMTLGKGLGGGYAPVSGPGRARSVVDVLAKGSGGAA